MPEPVSKDNENSWCQFCRDTTPHRYYICDEPCEDFLTWTTTLSEEEVQEEIAKCFEDA